MTKRSKSGRKNSKLKRSNESRSDNKRNTDLNNILPNHPQIDVHGEVGPERALSGALTFQCQLAHGSPTGIISGFSSLPQLYQAIASCYDGVNADDILFCTTNTHKVCMDHLLCSSLEANDFIFAHIMGQRKEVVLTKTEIALGLTVSDNGAGKSFVKRVRPNSICFKSHPAVQIGDYIEQIDNESMKGKRHFDVAHALRQISVGQTFTLRLVEPMKSAFDFVNGNTQRLFKHSIDDGMKTLRFRADGKAVIQEAPPCPVAREINEVFDSYLGFHDDELAQVAWEIGMKCSHITEMEARFKELVHQTASSSDRHIVAAASGSDFAGQLTVDSRQTPLAIQLTATEEGHPRTGSEIAQFDFPMELLFDIWGVLNDWKNSGSREGNL
uniref:PDZ domain-containing protein GIPC3 n=1 Tax=Ascaris suum TaxID=6253 RepID=F1L231_ASCSU